jgi:DNA-binding transcriptional regulator YhcF (GntR family)
MKTKTTHTKPTQSEYRVIELKFDKAEVPKFKEVKAKGYIQFGINNDYPKYLLSLYNESAKHGSIVKSKTTYIYGKGFSADGVVNSKGERWNDVLKKCIKDDELFRGYYLQIIWNRAKQISDIYHIDFSRVRVNKELTLFYVKNDWQDNREKAREYPAFNVNERYGSQILYVKEYNPYSEYYPLPNYFQGLNYIESDIEVSRHILGNAKKGFVASTLVNLNNGDPINEEHKAEIEKGILKKFSGHDSMRTIIMFNKSKENSAEIVNLGNSMLTKEDFTNVNLLIQQEIFAAHQVTSPILFGIKTEGQLGGRSEIRDAYEIFTNTYVNERQQEFEKTFTMLTEYVGQKVEMNIIPVEPLKFTFTEQIMMQVLTKDEIRDVLGKEPVDNNVSTKANNVNDNINALSPLVATKVLETMSPNEVRALAGLQPSSNDIQPTENTTTNSSPTDVQEEMQSNDALKNLTGRQYQNVMRIVKQYAKGSLNLVQAKLLLSKGYGLTENDINQFLGVEEKLSEEDLKFFDQEDERLYQAFASCGENINDFEVLESVPYRQEFDGKKWSDIHYKILELAQKTSKPDIQKWAEVIGESPKIIDKAYNELVNAGIIKLSVSPKEQNVKIDVVKQLPSKSEIKPTEQKKVAKEEVEQISIRYSYEWRSIVKDRNRSNSRPFCQMMMQLNDGGRTWSMKDIETISERVGYSVFDRCGGWWTQPNGEVSPQCRHEWVMRVVKKKK